MSELENIQETASEDLEPAEEPMDSAEADSTKRKGKHKIKFEATMQRREAAVYFRALVEGLESGRLAFRQGDDDLELVPAETVGVSVKASDKGSKQKVAFELEWRPGAVERLVVKR